MAMTERKNQRKALSFHTIYTFIYLPLSIALGAIIGLGRIYALKAIQPSSIDGIINILHAIFPLLSTLLSLVALPFLIGESSFGRKAVLFSSVFKALLSLLFVWAYLSYRNILPAFVYTIIIFLEAFIYSYYRSQRVFSNKVTEKEEPPVKEERTAEVPDTRKVEEKMTEAEPEKTTEEEVKEKSEEEPEEEKKEESPIEEKKEKEIEIQITECEERNVDEKETVKTTVFIPSCIYREIPIEVDEIKLTVLSESTYVRIGVSNRSNTVFTSTSWITGTGRVFNSRKVIRGGEHTEIFASINCPTDRIEFSLHSVTYSDGREEMTEGKTLLPKAERIELSSLSKDDSYSYFLASYLSEKKIEAKLAYSTSALSHVYICPRCGASVVDEDKCPICGLEKEKAELFSPSAVLSSFQKAKGVEKE